MSVGAIVVVTRDLMDGSRFRQAAPEVLVVRAIDDPAVEQAAVVVLDLASGVDPAAAVERGRPVIAYGAHVDTEALDAARAAGCADAIPRSQIFRRFAEVVAPYR